MLRFGTVATPAPKCRRRMVEMCDSYKTARNGGGFVVPGFQGAAGLGEPSSLKCKYFSGTFYFLADIIDVHLLHPSMSPLQV